MDEARQMMLLERVPASDGSVKYLWGLPDARRSVESITFTWEGSPHVCVSTQVGCPVGCVFCETGRQRWLGNLSGEEILLQARAAAEDRPVKRVVVAGMGEPLLNLEALDWAARRMLDDGITEEVSVTTSGVPGAMDRLADIPIVKLGISLHATTDAARERLIPTHRSYGLDRLIADAAAYTRGSGVPVFMNYLLLDGQNDSDDDLERLIRLLDPDLFDIRLKHWNQIEDGGLRASPPARFDHFVAGLRSAGFDACVDRSCGSDVGGGCGQLRSSVRRLRREAS